MTIFNKETWKQNWKIAVAVCSGLVLALVLLFVPMAVVPVHASQTYMVTENRSIPVTETIISTENYTDSVSRSQPVFQDRLVPVEWDRYVILDAYFDLSGKSNLMVNGTFISLDGRSVRFRIFNTYPYEIYPTGFSPAPVFQTNQDGGSFNFVPTTNHYYFVFDNYAYSFLRYFRLNANLTWTESTVKYRQVPKTQTVYKEVPVQVSQQRDVVTYERRSLFRLIAG